MPPLISSATSHAPTDAGLSEALNALLRPSDEAICLPGAQRSKASMTFKNVVMTLDGEEGNVPYKAFSSDWGHGTSLIRIPTQAAEGLLRSLKTRQELLQKLANGIRSELTDDLDVGPHLTSADNRDEADDAWTDGFDGPNCCVGLYAAMELHAPPNGTVGMTRPSKAYYLVAKAGAGVAAQEFSAQFNGLAQEGRSLNQIFSGDPMSEAHLNRVAAAGRRNRARILLRAAKVLGIAAEIDAVPDHAAHPEHGDSVAMLLADCCGNMLERAPAAGGAARRWRYFAGAVAPKTSQGVVISSNVAEGFVFFDGTQLETGATRLSHEGHGSAPLGSARLVSTSDAIHKAVEGHMANPNGGAQASCHPDSAWIRARFSWRTKAVGPGGQSKSATEKGLVERIEPPQLWGTHAPLDATQWAHEMSLGKFAQVNLHPEVVVLSGAEPTMMRAAVARASSSAAEPNTPANLW